MAEFKLKRGGIQHKFLNSTAKIQVFGGGFGNGKTAASCIKALNLSKLYPGSNGLIARETYPKLNDTIRKEFQTWCPKRWVKSFPQSTNATNTCTMIDGTMVNFRYIKQQNKQGGQQSTSNLLSATYDWIVIDQIEDPGITHKDLLDLLGRLRGNTPFCGDVELAESMGYIIEDLPTSGPRWLMVTCNPTSNWVYKKLIRPLQQYLKTGEVTDDLFCIRDVDTEEPILDSEGRVQLLIELFEGPTYENKDNLGADFIQTLESTYKGQMKERFLMGKWASYEGLVYPQFDEQVHVLQHIDMLNYLNILYQQRIKIEWLEAYDYGATSPSCYLLAFVDHCGNIMVIDGYHKPNFFIGDTFDKIGQITTIQHLRRHYGVPNNSVVLADPSTLKKQAGANRTVGKTVAELFEVDEFNNKTGIMFTAANNNIDTGIIKVGAFLNFGTFHDHPINDDFPAPRLYVSNELDFIADEMSTYKWAVDSQQEPTDVPVDKDDHAMDTLKYMLTNEVLPVDHPRHIIKVDPLTKWHELNSYDDPRGARHGRTG